MSTPFEVLGVDSDAEEAAVVRAYRRRVKETHPDQGGSASEFQAVKEAYEQILAGDADIDSAGESGGLADESGGLADESGDLADENDAERDAPAPSQVEYLNHAVLDDHQWKIDDDDLFEKAADADLEAEDYGWMEVEPGESLLEAAEERGFAWPFSCRGGACANCAVVIRQGELSQPVDHILPQELVEENIRLSCNGVPLTDELQVVYNVKHLPRLENLRLPPGPFEFAHTD